MAKPKLEDRPSAINRSDRPKRVRINGLRDKLAVEGLEAGWHYCWVNEDQVPRYERSEYEFVIHDVIVGDKQINSASQVGGRISMAAGNGVTAYLMRCAEEAYQEEHDALQAEVDERESQMRASHRALKEDGGYGDVKIQRK